MNENKKPKDKGFRKDASQFFIAGELCRRELVAVVTLGNCPNTDILCSNRMGTKFAHIQVKTCHPGDRTCSVGFKAEKNYGKNFFWIIGCIPKSTSNNEFEYYIIPSNEMSKNVQKSSEIWAKTPGKKGQKHDKNTTFRALVMPPRKNHNGWSIEKYRNRWDIIEKHLK